ncbi:CAP domain-containing protein [Armatimonas sp.]|uniref:CAP domain-containing protein n=1 Tax=Armatimonas sp. TaxID=1872638 RepID=UPI00286CFDCF|nr:CAP domain-containing protein [Armatimonas sp.]
MQYAYQTPGPQGTLRVSRPELSWPLLPKNGAQITAMELLLNGQPLEARYESGAVRATPPAPLSPGTYSVRCRVTLSPKQKDPEVSWTFTVGAGAIATLPPPSAWAGEALTAVNRLRARLGLAALQLDPRLCAAAQAHAAYLDKNNLIGHTQSPNKPGFVGETPLARAQAFGFLATLAEAVSLADGGADKAVRGLFDAPYHRLPFLRPGPLLFGAGHSGRASGLLFGGDGVPGTVMSPYDGETGVPTTWRNDEIPSPTRFLSNPPKVVGYPILLAHFSGSSPKLTVQSARLTTADGAEVKCQVNTPGQDRELTYACLLVPLVPLQPATTYIVEVIAKEVTRRWRFTTGGASEADYSPLDLRPGDLKLVGTVEKMEKSKELLTLRVVRAQSYGASEQELPRPISVTLKLSAQTRFVSQSGRGGTVNIAPGLPLAVIAPNGPLDRPIPARSVILLR